MSMEPQPSEPRPEPGWDPTIKTTEGNPEHLGSFQILIFPQHQGDFEKIFITEVDYRSIYQPISDALVRAFLIRFALELGDIVDTRIKSQRPSLSSLALPLSDQSRLLINLKIRAHLDSTSLQFFLDEIPFRFFFVTGREEFGCFFSNNKFFSPTIINTGGETTSTPLIKYFAQICMSAAIVIAVVWPTTAGPQSLPDPTTAVVDIPMNYSCMINGMVSSTQEQMLEDSINDLMPSLNETKEQEIKRIRSLQLCLKAAGFDPGKIDGIFGRDSKSALNVFAEKYGIGNPDLTSRVFLRFLIVTSSKEFSRRFQMSDDPLE